jgi:hypothetical protein
LQPPWNPGKTGLIDNIFTRKDVENAPKERNCRASPGQTTCQATMTCLPNQIAPLKEDSDKLLWNPSQNQD